MKALSLTGLEIAQSIKKGEIAEDEVFSAFNQNIKDKNKKLNSFVDVYDQPLKSCATSSLKGVPIAVKDNICIKGKKITCASKILSNHIAVYDATVITKLKEAGLNIAGTANMDEFAFGSSTETSCYGVVRNPWNKDKVAGGSSGGSAASVGCRQVPLALGSDTGGSIRQPASLCGVVGFKPTYGRVSRYGLIAFGSSLDQIGPFSTNIIDCAHLLNVICGYDSKDSTSAKVETDDFTKALATIKKGTKVGIAKEYFAKGLNSEVKNAVEGVISVLKKKGACIVEISLPHTEYAVATYYIIASSEASANLQRFDGVRYGLREKRPNLIDMYSDTRKEGFGAEAKRRIFLGAHSLSSGYYDAYFLRALKVRRLIKEDFDKVFNEVDIILTPTSPTAAFNIGEKSEDPISMYLSDVYTISANLAGLPAVSLPCGFTKDNLPIGVQFIAKAFDESSLVSASFTYQQETNFHKRIPNV
ncbi:MAG: Asp-tRNA(Asn)/Glu-tRNA(Gln) amidotransferase subunit GatA [Candidatus Omnitrophica bacterium]|nr:Asp-tRNA(Asn)/Glu-tRNA(Gln) amidotransferase subunit GatA [Candidatus Omnitrophota bacterium]